MDLDICLYCEKPISDNSTSFCSNTCRKQESKQEVVGGSFQPDYRMVRSNSLHSLTPTSTPPPNFYEMAYHRRQSFSYSPPMRRRPSHSLSSSSSINSLSSSALSFDAIRHFHPLAMDDALSYPVYTSE
ncbi:hypothetical protein BCR42DRAFT_419859 [Absidia repens]|uniref:Uncharacterized protein n=1 Tax=Absidia repens TaxID=90262 RepID=A0A1X2IAN3_9FUNG|nr:hypothetical protein BCR42DRAFT_419859 [Absidia repens]